MSAAPAGGVAARLAADRERLLERLESAARRMRRGDGLEASHDVRVATRRLDALLDVWRDVLPRGRRRRARRALRDLRRALGPARERRVGIDLLRDRMSAVPPDVRTAIGVVIGRWEHDLDALEKAAGVACRRGQVRRVRRAIERAFPRLPEGPLADVRLGAAGRARAGLRQRRAVRRVRRAGEDPRDGRLHAARVAIKRWRYGLERVCAAGAAPADGIRETLIAMQQTLGRVQDLAVLRDEVRVIRRQFETAGAAADAFGPVVEDLERERRACVETFGRQVAAAGLSGTVLPMPPGRHSAQG